MNTLKTALLLLLYPVLYLRLPLTLRWFAASTVGLATFVILLTALRDLYQSDGFNSRVVAPLIAYWGGYSTAGAVVLLHAWVQRAFPRPVVATRVESRAILQELEPIARNAAAETLENAIFLMTEQDKSKVVFSANLGDEWAVFDWYVPAKRPRNARVVLRAAVNRETKNVVLEISPTPAKHPHSVDYLILRSSSASAAMGAGFSFILAIRHNARFHEWPSLYELWHMFLFSWIPCLAFLLLILFRFRAMVPVRLPSGKLLFVDRATARGR